MSMKCTCVMDTEWLLGRKEISYKFHINFFAREPRKLTSIKETSSYYRGGKLLQECYAEVDG